ncbi:hypothetical protein PTQ27_08215 [Mannheimia sp. AT1]|uniref:PepSY domain-containing protein n=1 Tax=Mannheimia cairinae TaxID=3025936 RepID=A0ABT5MQK1_9PAST|nr:hypothetical protein [Mannheimia cairinae]MDD0824445.1 hypothetical protein [Mannheimia cairinae]MDD0825546.1 hypothetical protein [Mannheimia cairinae]
MKSLTKALFILAPFISGTAFANSIPDDIYQPKGELIKAQKQGNEFEVEYKLQGDDVRDIAKKATEHAKRKGFRIVESEIKKDDADLKFKRGNQELDVEIEAKGKNRIEYKAELDLDKN